MKNEKNMTFFYLNDSVIENEPSFLFLASKFDIEIQKKEEEKQNDDEMFAWKRNGGLLIRFSSYFL